MFVAEIVNVQVNENLLDEKGKICLEKADLVAYVHGAYHPIVRKPIGRFGYSVMKPKTRKRIAAQKRTNSRRGGKTRTGRKR